MKIGLIAFTENGLALARYIAGVLADAGDETSVARGFGEGKTDHHFWTAEHFAADDALVFVGACGIAVRSIAPHLKSKAEDPAVVVIDEKANFCIPLLSGHIGGANALAVRIAEAVEATPVVTTATDVSGIFAVDTWAVGQGLVVATPQRIKLVSGALLAGSMVTFASEIPVKGTAPTGVMPVEGNLEDLQSVASIYLGADTRASGLRLVPRNAILGVGCRKDTPAQQIEAGVSAFLRDNNVDPRSITKVASIDLKSEEPGLLALCANHNWPFETFPSEVLNQQEGEFTVSEFVQGVTGTSSVCERAAVAAGGALKIAKTVVEGMTCALATFDVEVSWPGA